MKNTFICCNLDENYGMTVYDSKEQLVEYLGEGFGVDTFEELMIEMKGFYEVIEVKGEFELKTIVEYQD